MTAAIVGLPVTPLSRPVTARDRRLCVPALRRVCPCVEASKPQRKKPCTCLVRQTSRCCNRQKRVGSQFHHPHSAGAAPLPPCPTAFGPICGSFTLTNFFS